MIENYIYLYHISKCIILPTWPESIQDSQSVTFTPTTPLGRTAPIYSYSYSGPRTVQVNLKLHRDMMYDINYVDSDLLIDTSGDYIDAIVSQIQSIALPQYDSAAKMINPPLVAVRFGDEFFIKGVVTGSVGVTSELPIIQTRDGKSKYAQSQFFSFRSNSFRCFYCMVDRQLQKCRYKFRAKYLEIFFKPCFRNKFCKTTILKFWSINPNF